LWGFRPPWLDRQTERKKRLWKDEGPVRRPEGQRINEQIRIAEVRVIGADGAQLGILRRPTPWRRRCRPAWTGRGGPTSGRPSAVSWTTASTSTSKKSGSTVALAPDQGQGDSRPAQDGKARHRRESESGTRFPAAQDKCWSRSCFADARSPTSRKVKGSSGRSSRALPTWRRSSAGRAARATDRLYADAEIGDGEADCHPAWEFLAMRGAWAIAERWPREGRTRPSLRSCPAPRRFRGW